MTIRHQFLSRMRTPVTPGQRQDVERVLAAARIFLALSSWVAILVDPTQPARYEVLAHVLLSLFLVHSIGVYITLRVRTGVGRIFPWVLQAIDLLWPAVISWFTEGPSSPFYPFFFFALMAAAFRWAFIETMATAVIADALLLLQAWLSTAGAAHIHPLLAGPFELNTFVVRITYLLIVGALLGYLAQKEKELRAQTNVTARLLEEARARSGVRGTLSALMGEMLRLFEAKRAVLALTEAGSKRVYLWEARPTPRADQVVVELQEAPAAERDAWFPAAGELSFYAERSTFGLGRRWRTLALQPDGRRTRDLAGMDPQRYPGGTDANSLMLLSLTLGDEWSGCLVLYDARPGMNSQAELRFAQALLQRIGPRAYTIYLLHQLRSRAGAIERARVARELHDGAIQSLIGAEMRVDVLRRQPNGENAAELAEIQQVLRNEVLNLRELMQQMKPVELDPRQLLDYLADMVERFRRDTGIAARFVSDQQETMLPPHTCRELARILQEALVNIRKHSGAQNVLVHFHAEEGRWKLIVEDDGRGFDFTGRLGEAELENPRRGPAIIKERVRGLGGDLTIDSHPGQGSRLEISIPQKTGYNVRVDAAL